jgi:anti-sigma factor RsiW
MISSAFVTDDELHAYVDGALDAAQRIRVAALAFGDHAMSARLHAYRTQNAGLKALFGAALQEAIPERMLRLVREGSHETFAVAG